MNSRIRRVRPAARLSSALRCVAVAVLALPLGLADAREETEGKDEPTTKEGSDDAVPRGHGAPVPSGGSGATRFLYVPRGRGAPSARIGGGTRSIETADTPRVWALAPEEVGLTLEEQPVLYWYLPSDTQRDIEITLSARGLDEPLLRKRLKGPLSAGVQRVKLADHGIELTLDLPYLWYVSVVTNGDQIAYAGMSGAGIERISVPPELAAALASAAAADRARVLATGGIWYDALDEISRDIEASPDDAALRSQRAALFEQVGLASPAGADRGE